MVCALPVKVATTIRDDKTNAGQLGLCDAWGDRLKVAFFNGGPIVGGCRYIENLVNAGRPGVLRMVRAILKGRK